MTPTQIQALINTAKTSSTDLVTWVELKAILEALKDQDGVSSFKGREGAVMPEAGDYNTTLVAEGNKLYFTTERARASISVAGDLVYDPQTGIISHTATADTDTLDTVTDRGNVTTNTITVGGLDVVDGNIAIDSMHKLFLDKGYGGAYLIATGNGGGVRFGAGYQDRMILTDAGRWLLGFTPAQDNLTDKAQINGSIYVSSTAKIGSLAGTGARMVVANADGSLTTQSIPTNAVTSVFGRTGIVTASNGDYTTSQVTESGNLYFTQARARQSISAGAGISVDQNTGVIASLITQYTDGHARSALSVASGAAGYNANTGVISIPTATNQLTNNSGYITTSDLSGFVPYTGATANVDLGARYLLSQRFQSSGGELISVLIKGRASDNKGRIEFYSNNGGTQQAYLEAGPNGVTNLLNIVSGNSTLQLTNSYISTNGKFLVNTSTDNLSGAVLQVSGAATFSSSVTATKYSSLSSSSYTNDILNDNIGTIGQYVGVRFGYNGSTYNKGAIYYISQDANGRGNMVFALEPNGNSANVSTANNTMTLTYQGNIGIGVTPSAWGGTSKVVEFSSGGIESRGSVMAMWTNAYYNGISPIYKTSAAASNYYQLNGEHIWLTAPSGTAGNTISFTQAMTLDASGRLGIGTTSPNTPLSLVSNHISGQSTFKIQTVTAYSSSGLSSIGFNDSDGSRKGIIYTNSDGLQLETTVSTPILFNTNGNTKATLTSGGNLLIGTTTDNGSDKLQVNGSLSTTSNITMNSGQFTAFLGNGLVRTANADNSGLLHIRPNQYKDGYITFTENAVADRWAIGITNGDGAFHFKYPYPSSATVFKIYNNGYFQTASPSGYTAVPWRLGNDQGFGTNHTPTRSIAVEINGAIYFLQAVAASDL